MSGLKFNYLHIAILIAIGLQHKDVDDLCTELNLPSNQVLACFNKSVRKIGAYLKKLLETSVAKESQVSSSVLSRVEQRVSHMQPLLVNLSNDLKADSSATSKAKGSLVLQQQQELIMTTKDISKHSIKPAVLNSTVLEHTLEQSLKRDAAIPSSISIPVAVVPGSEGEGTPAAKKHKHEHKSDKKAHKHQKH